MKRELTLKQRIIAFFLMVLFVGYIGNLHFFAHKHTMGDVVVVHSHMGSSTHNHTVAAINTIFSISNYDTTSNSVLDISEVVEFFLCEILEKTEIYCYVARDTYFSLRAPPIL